MHYTSPKKILKRRMGEITKKITIENMRKKNEDNYEKRIR